MKTLCGNALYEGINEPLSTLRERYRCEKYGLSCKDCPVYDEKTTIKKEV